MVEVRDLRSHLGCDDSSAFQMHLLWFLWGVGFRSLCPGGRAKVEPYSAGQGGRSFETEGGGIVESGWGVGVGQSD